MRNFPTLELATVLFSSKLFRGCIWVGNVFESHKKKIGLSACVLFRRI